jgi:nucleotide-binding universal stress UspA family protein
VAEWSYPILVEDAVAAAEQHAGELTRDATRIFDAWRQQRSLPTLSQPAQTKGVSVSWHEEVGASALILRDVARFCDMVVMRGLGEDGPVEGDSMLEAVLFEAGRPVLLVPSKAPAALFRSALIAWGGGREELHAVTAALPILARMEQVDICTVGSSTETKLDQLVAYLAWNGIAARPIALDPGPGSVGDALVEQARRSDASLLVMGGYHHSRMREVVFGGTTRRIVTKVEIPVLLAH